MKVDKVFMEYLETIKCMMIIFEENLNKNFQKIFGMKALDFVLENPMVKYFLEEEEIYCEDLFELSYLTIIGNLLNEK